MQHAYDMAHAAADWLRARIPAPSAAAVLGSGLGALADQLEDAVQIPYGEIPHFPAPKVSGHAGVLSVGRLPGRKTVVAALSGRVHLYEGHPIEEVVHAVRTMALWGVRDLVITNAAGGIDGAFAPGDLMLITDHLNLTGKNPLWGVNDDRLGQRFPDMSHAYSPTLRRIVQACARDLGQTLRSGVYAGVMGPSYETPAEIRMLGHVGAAAVGMSTVNEVIAARHAGLQVCGISCITNLAAGLSATELHHDEVKTTAELARERFLALVCEALERFAERPER
ncbi:MAG: purine-nucleoside phosphorylase [Myxococcales bacterium]|nr:purine-nucleoside phosphorylase [Myxococcales bacterium]MCB9524484.1 purine-nucleoside phosphorylase [Myxococcales bacterium]